MVGGLGSHIFWPSEPSQATQATTSPHESSLVPHQFFGSPLELTGIHHAVFITVADVHIV